MTIEGYTKEFGSIFFRQSKGNVEINHWLEEIINVLKKIFPMADHYPTSRGRQIGIGSKKVGIRNGEPSFFLFFKNGSPCFKITVHKFKSTGLDESQRFFNMSDGEGSGFEEWLTKMIKNIDLQNLEMGNGRMPDDYSEADEGDGSEERTPSSILDEGIEMKMPLNQILYGPPGTGKTYRTVELAVRCAEPEFKESGTTKIEVRKSFKKRFDQLIHKKRIRFVTFHQSYGYEEFVEGLSAKTEGDQLSYYEKSGVFKTICEDAKAYMGENKEIYRAEFDDLWQRFSDALAEEPSGIKINSLSEKTYFTITDISDSTIRFDKAQGKSVHSLSVKTLKAIYKGEKELTGGLQPYYGALIKFLKTSYESKTPNVTKKRENYVLVIDEINRGNISKIFGELITLIEPSKRLKKPEDLSETLPDESLSVTLPYTGDSFGVPDNVFIIGTMNTADRSLALMDTALRRRFEFIEMMPDYSALKDDKGNAHSIRSDETIIDLVKLLKTLNDRIAALYDREHTLGHAFFIPVVEQIINGKHAQALVELARVFKTKIIPLLAEYFFEDWQKIRLVIGDNQKGEKYQIVTRSRMELDGLFGDSSELDTSSDSYAYSLADDDSDIWLNALTYVGMYDPAKLKS